MLVCEKCSWYTAAFHTQELLHTDLCTHRNLYTQTLLHTETCTQALLHTNAFTDRHFHTHGHALTHRQFYTKTHLHTEAFTHRCFYVQTLLHTKAFTNRNQAHRHFHTETLAVFLDEPRWVSLLGAHVCHCWTVGDMDGLRDKNSESCLEKILSFPSILFQDMQNLIQTHIATCPFTRRPFCTQILYTRMFWHKNISTYKHF